jgi:AcrR family transcriptional regulator
MRTEDRRVSRTRRALRQALVDLLPESAYESITVQDIARRADVGRSTFYAHYVDKEDLLVESLRELGELVAVDQAEPLGFARPLLEHVAEVRPMFRALLGRCGPTVVQDTFAEMIREVLRNTWGAGIGREDATVHFVAAGFVAIARWWVLERPDLGVDEVHAHFLALATPLVSKRSRGH